MMENSGKTDDEQFPEHLLIKISSMIEGQSPHVQRIPEIENKLSAVEARQTLIESRYEAESKEWRQSQEDIAVTRQLLKTTVENVDKVQKSAKAASEAAKHVGSSVRKTLWKVLGGVAGASLSVILVVVGAAWKTGGQVEGLSQRITAEKSVREVQYQTLTSRLDRLPTREQTPTRKQLTHLEKSIRVSDFSLRCSNLSEQQKESLRRQVRAGRLPSSFLCE